MTYTFALQNTRNVSTQKRAKSRKSVAVRVRAVALHFLVDFIFVDIALANRFIMSAKIFLSPNYKLRENALASTAR